MAPSLYHEFKDAGANPITRLATTYDRAYNAFVVVPPPDQDHLFDAVLHYVWQTYGSRPAVALSRLTHVKDGPWDRARREAEGLIGKDIPNSYIEKYFWPLVKSSSG